MKQSFNRNFSEDKSSVKILSITSRVFCNRCCQFAQRNHLLEISDDVGRIGIAMGTPGDKSGHGKKVASGQTPPHHILEPPEDFPAELLSVDSELLFPEPGTSSIDMTIQSRLPEFPRIDYNIPDLPDVKLEPGGMLEQAHIEDYYSQTKYYQQNLPDSFTKTPPLFPIEPEVKRDTFHDLDRPGPSGLQTPKARSVPTLSKLNPKRTKKSQVTPQVIKKTYACQHCPKSFQNSANLSKHHQQIHAGSSPFKCEHCKKSFTSKFKLVRHVLIHSDRKPFSCSVCERTFHRKDHLKNHIKVHSPSKKIYVCEVSDCKKEYTSSLSYRKHAALHAAEAGQLECLICSKKFETKDDILYHLKIHAGSRTVKSPNERKFTCDQCDRRFFTRKDVRRHMVVHTGMRDFLCQFCPQRFGRKDHLVRHIKKSHSKNYTSEVQQEETIVKEEMEDVKFEVPESLPEPEFDSLIQLPQSYVQEVLGNLDMDIGEDSPAQGTTELIDKTDPVLVGPPTVIETEDILVKSESEIIVYPDPRENLPLPAFSKTFQSPPQP